ncbi:ribonuclease M5 [Exiguobacterium phage vB_EalM-132]|nr:ribonuclease M5 [Exiguobacterium phage vB_EalM-132]
MCLVLIVEGMNDRQQILNAKPLCELDFVVTGGTKMNNGIKNNIDKHLQKGNRLVLLTDPDEAGDQIVQMVQRFYPSIPRVEVNKDEANYFTGRKYKYGVEYCGHKYLRELIGGL